MVGKLVFQNMVAEKNNGTYPNTKYEIAVIGVVPLFVINKIPVPR
jgi:hypothetical protein